MVFPAFSLRAATSDDVGPLVELMLVSSHGGLADAFAEEAKPREGWRQAARRIVGDRDAELGFGNVVIAESAGKPVGMVLLNALPEAEIAPDAQGGPLRLRLTELLNRALPAMMIREIAVDEAWRGRGVARALLDAAAILAGNTGLPRLTLTVNEANTGALAAYRRLGFALVARGPCFPHRHWPASAATLLMQRPAGGLYSAASR
jgi:GNAT superfamily N-acetyltransferase